MMDKEEFDLMKESVEWLESKGINFVRAMHIFAYAAQEDITLAESYAEFEKEESIKHNED